MNEDRIATASSYAGAGVSVFAGLTLTEWGILTGILTAILTFALNMWFQRRRDRREQELHDLKIAKMEGKA